MRKLRFEARFLAMWLEFPRAIDWLDQLSKSKWTQAYDEGKQYGHMTINLAECMNFVLKGAWALLITTLVMETFNKINDSFVTKEMKKMNMIKIGHKYFKEVYVMMQKNRHIATWHYVWMYIQGIEEFKVQKITKYPTWATSNDMYSQIEPMMVWLWRILGTSNSLLTCNCNMCFLQFRMWWLCWPYIQVGKYL